MAFIFGKVTLHAPKSGLNSSNAKEKSKPHLLLVPSLIYVVVWIFSIKMDCGKYGQHIPNLNRSCD